MCVFVRAFLCACVCLCNSVPLKADGVSKGVVWRSSVCSVDNWDLELKHRGGRWCVGFCFHGCLCVRVCMCMDRQTRLNTVCEFVCLCVLTETHCRTGVSSPRRYRCSLRSESGLIPGQPETDLRPICYHDDRCDKDWP